MKMFKITRDGELTSYRLKAQRLRYRPNTVFLHPIASLIILILCASVDVSCFLSTVSRVSGDNLRMQVISVLGMGVGYDLTPIYMSVVAKQIHLGLSNEKRLLHVMCAVVMLAMCLNLGFNLSTMHMVTPDEDGNESSTLVQQQVGDADTAEGEEESFDKREAIALTLFNIITPIITSVTSFAVGYLTYDPLGTKKCQMEAAIWAEENSINRARACLDEYHYQLDKFYENATESDEVRYNAILKKEGALVLGYCSKVRYMLMLQIPSPQERTALSRDQSEKLLKQLTDGIARLEACYEAAGVPVKIPPEVPQEVPTEVPTGVPTEVPTEMSNLPKAV